MRFGTTIAVGALLSCALGVTRAAAQPVPCQTCQSPACGCEGHAQDCCCGGLSQQCPPNPLAPGRPSPPPCCADGFCYPNYETWGHYATRWRRWPIEFAAPTPRGAQPAPVLGPDVPTHVKPPVEEEDRRAPPPSAPRGEALETGPRAAPADEGTEEERSTGPAESSGSSGTEPLTDPLFGPVEEAPSLNQPSEETPGVTPFVPPGGSETPQADPIFDEPMGDLDSPPAPPFARLLDQRPTVRSTSKPAAPAPKRDVRTAPQDDPPPAMPGALASLSN